MTTPSFLGSDQIGFSSMWYGCQTLRRENLLTFDPGETRRPLIWHWVNEPQLSELNSRLLCLKEQSQFRHTHLNPQRHSLGQSRQLRGYGVLKVCLRLQLGVCTTYIFTKLPEVYSVLMARSVIPFLQ